MDQGGGVGNFVFLSPILIHTTLFIFGTTMIFLPSTHCQVGILVLPPVSLSLGEIYYQELCAPLLS